MRFCPAWFLNIALLLSINLAHAREPDSLESYLEICDLLAFSDEGEALECYLQYINRHFPCDENADVVLFRVAEVIAVEASSVEAIDGLFPWLLTDCISKNSLARGLVNLAKRYRALGGDKIADAFLRLTLSLVPKGYDSDDFRLDEELYQAQ